MDMSANSEAVSPPASGGNKSDNYSPVTVHLNDMVGAILLGILTLSMFIALLRAEARNRALAANWARSRA